MGVTAKPLLFDELIRTGYLHKPANTYELTDLGLRHGGYATTANGDRYVVWNRASIRSHLVRVKTALLARHDFRLFHMTHIDNLAGIVTSGLFSHDRAPEHRDISNRAVNARRARTETIHNRALHEYVPLYFNPRNAMLYKTQADHGDRIVLIEIKPQACLADYTIFADRNAAATDCRFAYCLSEVENFRWDRIREKNWKTDGIVNVDTRQLMMSECLVYNHIDAALFGAIHAKSSRIAEEIRASLGDRWHPDIRVSRDWFF